MRKTVDFLADLRENNNKPWFDANKASFVEAQSEFNDFALRLLEGIGEFDESVRGLQLRDISYRIYRDVRFSNDKTPYKTHFGTYICRGGKKSGYAGYYFHVEAPGADYIGNNILAAGSYCPPPKVLESIRTDIYDDPQRFIGAIDNAKGFRLQDESRLKRAPKGFPADFEHIGLLMYRDYSLYKVVTREELLSPELFDRVLADFKAAKPFLDLLNRATQYAFEEM